MRLVARSRAPATAALPTGPGLLALVLVALLAADVGLVDLDGAGEGRAGDLGPAGLADAVGQVPGGLLGDGEVAMQLHGGDALEAGGEQVDGHDPDLAAELGVVHEGVGLHREVLAAGAAAEGLGLARGALEDVAGVAAGALRPGGPAGRDEPLLGAGIIGEAAHELHEGQAFTE